MRVLHTSPYFAPAYAYGGPPRSILALCRAQQHAGVEVEVFTTTANPGEELSPSINGLTYESVPVKYFARVHPRWLFHAPSMRAPLMDAVAHADVVHQHTLFNATAWLSSDVASKTRRPIVLSTRGMLTRAALRFHAVRKKAAWWLFDEQVVERAHVLHASSADEAETLRQLRPHQRVVHIPNAVQFDASFVTPELRARVRERVALPRERRFVLYLGRLHPIKRLDILASAFLAIAARDKSVDLVIAGEGLGSVRQEIRDLLTPVADRVHWAGAVVAAERDALLLEASALVLCSDSENFGMSVAEALAAGLPVVVTQTCPWALVADAGAGMWVEQSADAVADGLQHILADPERAAEMGERGRLLAAREFSLPLIGQRWLALYNEVATAA